jgi:hypothetical protein
LNWQIPSHGFFKEITWIDVEKITLSRYTRVLEIYKLDACSPTSAANASSMQREDPTLPWAYTTVWRRIERHGAWKTLVQLQLKRWEPPAAENWRKLELQLIRPNYSIESHLSRDSDRFWWRIPLAAAAWLYTGERNGTQPPTDSGMAVVLQNLVSNSDSEIQD